MHKNIFSGDYNLKLQLRLTCKILPIIIIMFSINLLRGAKL